MLAGILQIRSPSGSNGLYILKINPDMKKQPALLQAVKGIVGSDYYTLDLQYNIIAMCRVSTKRCIFNTITESELSILDDIWHSGCRVHNQ